MSGAPRYLYLHGFASGPNSTKGVELGERFAERGVTLERLNLRVPSLERLSFGAMMNTVRAALGESRDRAVVFGSSLGGLTACRVAEDDARIAALVLLAPAFRLAERWRQRLGEDGWRRWRETTRLDVQDYAENRATRVHFDFVRELSILDGKGDGWPDVRVPTLVIHGTRDETVDVQLSRDFASGKPWVHLVEVDDGHELTDSLDRIHSEAESFLRPFLGG